MTQMKVVTLDAYEQHGTALIQSDDSVWVVYAPRPWDIATMLWWFFCPADKKGWATLTTRDKRKVRARVIRIAHRHVRIGSNDIEVGFQG